MEGPSGGVCTNVECGNCGTRMNIASLPDGPLVIEIQATNPTTRTAYHERMANRTASRWTTRLAAAVRKLVHPSETIPHA